MTTIRKLLAACAALALLALPVPAFAGTSPVSQKAWLCSSAPAVGTSGPRRVVNSSSTASPQPSYVLNADGCALMSSTDVPYFLANGFFQGTGIFSIFAGPFTAQSTTTNSPTLPANAYIIGIVIQETTGNAVTGGLDIGIAGSSDATIASAFAVGANAVIAITGSTLLKQVFPTSGTTGPAAQQIFFNAHTNWTDGASINVTILYAYF